MIRFRTCIPGELGIRREDTLAWLQKEVLAPVPLHHVILTMPRLLRGIFRKRRELLLDLSQCAAEAVAEYVRKRLGQDCGPGIVVSIATASDLVQWHPHAHLLSTDGGFSNGGAFHPLGSMDPLEWLARLADHIPDPGRQPPPQIRDVLRVPVDDEGREIELQPA